MISQLLKGDCLELMKDIEDESIDLIFCDPPYGISMKASRKGSKFSGVEIKNDKELDWVPSFYKQIYRISKNVSLVFCGWSTIDVFMREARNAGFIHKNTIVWNKMHFGMGWNFRPQYELILVLTKGAFKTKNHNVANLISVKRMHHTKMSHIAEKPLELLELLIRETTEEGDIVLDPFCGSSSTLVAAKRLGRKYIGMELDEEYFKAGIKRLEKVEEVDLKNNSAEVESKRD